MMHQLSIRTVRQWAFMNYIGKHCYNCYNNQQCNAGPFPVKKCDRTLNLDPGSGVYANLPSQVERDCRHFLPIPSTSSKL